MVFIVYPNVILDALACDPVITEKYPNIASMKKYVSSQSVE
jgi:hypothetical protein